MLSAEMRVISGLDLELHSHREEFEASMQNRHDVICILMI